MVRKAKKATHRVLNQKKLVVKKRRSSGSLMTRDGLPILRSSMALVINQEDGSVIYAKRSSVKSPIASLTKLMTAMVAMDANLPPDDLIAVTEDDVDTLKGTSSRLKVGATLSRQAMLHLALMASENRAASALARAYPGGAPAFVAAMNKKARDLGMTQTHFLDSTGLNAGNLSTAEDLAKMVNASYEYSMIRQFSTSQSYEVVLDDYRRPIHFGNTNALVKNESWDIGLSKTGYISEAGRCLVMQARIAQQAVIIVLLDSQGMRSRLGDANRLKQWMEAKLLRANGNKLAKL
jgi:D-alanyl-D-alanine endopeptidase (penicillin-binding protein 7)